MFLAPEVCKGLKHDGRLADVYALGVCLFMFVYGMPPFQVRRGCLWFHVGVKHCIYTTHTACK